MFLAYEITLWTIASECHFGWPHELHTRTLGTRDSVCIESQSRTPLYSPDIRADMLHGI